MVPEYKKVGWNYQPTKCPLLKHERFSAYQMSITPQITYFNLNFTYNFINHSFIES